jgi:amino-acid N-acetyltransferase
MPPESDTRFVSWFRSVAPYFHAFRGRTFVVAFGGEVLADGNFVGLAHDLNLLHSAGIRLVLVHGSRPQINRQLKRRRLVPRYSQDMRITDATALECVKEAVGVLRVEIEAQLSQGLPNSPMAGAAIRLASGNYITAQPIGILDGVDFHYTGQVRRVDSAAIAEALDHGRIVLVSNLGYSPTGEVFNLAMEDVALATAVALKADKLVFLSDAPVADRDGKLLPELTAQDAERLLVRGKHLSDETRRCLTRAARAVRDGVARAHVVSRGEDGALLIELFTHAGSGTMLTADKLERLRPATIEDVGGILQLIEPLEAEGTLVRRGRERLEQEIGRFFVIEHDQMILGCAALYPFPRTKSAEMAALAVRPEYRGRGYGEKLLEALEVRARAMGMQKLFVLTTRTAHWFIERGFVANGVGALPKEKRGLYNWQRRSKVLVKTLR